jgi:hypothetical protein
MINGDTTSRITDEREVKLFYGVRLQGLLYMLKKSIEIAR